jgi:long-chain acyl-CoA synthetase
VSSATSPHTRACRTIARLAKVLEVALTDVDLTLPQYRALAFLEVGTVAPSTLAGLLTVSRPTITALVDGLVARGLVERRADPTDRRRVEHRLTDAGAKALALADRVAAQRLDELLARVGDEDRATGRAGLEVWARALAEARRTATHTPPTTSGPS